LFSQIAAPCGEVGPIRINFAPDLAKACAAQGIELGANGFNPRADNPQFVAFGPLVTKQDGEALRFFERRGELGEPARSGTRYWFG
jgi:hypothetical protein